MDQQEIYLKGFLLGVASYPGGWDSIREKLMKDLSELQGNIVVLKKLGKKRIEDEFITELDRR